MTKKYFIIVAALFIAVGLFVVILSVLVIEQSDESVFAGGFLMVLFPIVFHFFINQLKDDSKGSKYEEDQ